MKKITRKKWLWGVSALMVVFLAIQLVHPDWKKIVKPETMQKSAEIHAPENVKSILKNSCFACHSNETQLSWFDKITPANFLVASHIKKGKAALNFSDWDKLTPPQQKGELYYSLNKILEKEMPLASYAMIHTEAKLTKENIDILKRYVAGMTPRKTTSASEIAASDDQFKKWQKPDQEKKTTVQPSPNGIQYIEGYGSWKAMSTTDRFDNGTMRVIFVNAVGENAISNRKTNPWPDGTVFAKVAWKEKTDTLGNITPGEFYQVEFMIKDQKKYAETKGWGWARWRGADLKPYGKDASFTTECVSCHTPLKDNDYVFTYPLNLQSAK
ncbi:MAG: heme-binding domain-containing protein [Prolixibacteraceae bacterium]|jgi:hypothetical protein